MLASRPRRARARTMPAQWHEACNVSRETSRGTPRRGRGRGLRETPRIYRPLEDLEEDGVRRQCIVSLAHKSELQRDLVAIERRKSEKAEREPLLVVFGVGARVNGQWCRRRYLLGGPPKHLSPPSSETSLAYAIRNNVSRLHPLKPRIYLTSTHHKPRPVCCRGYCRSYGIRVAV